MTKTKKLRYWLKIEIWKPNMSKSELSQQASPGVWMIWRDYSFPNQPELDAWLDRPHDRITGQIISRREYYERAKAADDNYLFKLSQYRK